MDRNWHLRPRECKNSSSQKAPKLKQPRRENIYLSVKAHKHTYILFIQNRYKMLGKIKLDLKKYNSGSHPSKKKGNYLEKGNLQCWGVW